MNSHEARTYEVITKLKNTARRKHAKNLYIIHSTCNLRRNVTNTSGTGLMCIRSLTQAYLAISNHKKCVSLNVYTLTFRKTISEKTKSSSPKYCA